MPFDEDRTRRLFAELGFDPDSDEMHELLGAIDADQDGDISLAEFVTGVGMMKRAVLQATTT